MQRAFTSATSQLARQTRVLKHVKGKCRALFLMHTSVLCVCLMHQSCAQHTDNGAKFQNLQMQIYGANDSRCSLFHETQLLRTLHFKLLQLIVQHSGDNCAKSQPEVSDHP